MIRKQVTIIAAAVFAAMSGTALAQTTSGSSNTSTTAGQTVAPSASTTVNTEANFKAMPHSTVTIAPSGTTN